MRTVEAIPVDNFETTGARPAEPALLQGYTRDELLLELWNHAEYKLEIGQFYVWLPYCLCKKKKLYTKRDLAKFVFVANFMKRVRSLETAQAALEMDIKLNPDKYPIVTESPAAVGSN